MKLTARRIIVISLISLICAGAILVALSSSNRLIMSSVSPDGIYRLEVTMRRVIFQMDNNYAFRLYRNGALFHQYISPDEPYPIYNNAIIWSKASDAVYVVGGNYNCEPAYSNNGLFLYYVYDMSTGSYYCNSSQDNTNRFMIDSLRAASLFSPEHLLTNR
jgi:hypothetical protein